MSGYSLEQVRGLIRDIPDFPKKGILFKDITPVLASPGALSFLCEQLAKPFQSKGIKKVMAIESRGFFFGTGVAERLGAGLIPVRKAGKLPWQTVQESYALEYGEAVLEVHRDAISAGEKVLLIDDVLATGGTLRAAKSLALQLGGEVMGAACLLEIDFLKGRRALDGLPIHTLWSV
ncbi:MAG: adenine phosphoribosyltransferase [Bdellovibrionota bacterium]